MVELLNALARGTEKVLKTPSLAAAFYGTALVAVLITAATSSPDED